MWKNIFTPAMFYLFWQVMCLWKHSVAVEEDLVNTCSLKAWAMLPLKWLTISCCGRVFVLSYSQQEAQIWSSLIQEQLEIIMWGKATAWLYIKRHFTEILLSFFFWPLPDCLVINPSPNTLSLDSLPPTETPYWPGYWESARPRPFGSALLLL